MGSTAATFNGTSKYADDLQQAINRAVNIAALPLKQLNQNVSQLQAQSDALSTLESKFAAIQTAIRSLGSATSGGGLAASVSDESVATVSVDSNAVVAAGTYTLTVTDPGAATTTLSNDGLLTVTDPTSTSISSASSFTLTVNGSPFTVTPTSNTLIALAQAINSAGADVSASIINIGPPSAPDYRLSLQSTALGDVPIQLNDGSQDLLTTLTHGSPAQYQVNGQPSTPITSDSRSVTIAPGVTVDLLAAGETQVNVSPDSSAVADALASFVAAYNAAAGELAQDHGDSGGALTGLSVVFQLEQALRELVRPASGDAGVQSLAELGVTFNGTTGQLSFNQTTFASVAAAHPDDVAAFLGSTTGGGFLTTATDRLATLENTDGLLPSQIDSVQKQIDNENQKINDAQTRLIKLNNDLVKQMSAADAAIAALQSQLDFFTALFTETQNVRKNS